jgi:bifunctional UDP-N-acetylglucosamine pyrophosphorylase/glucosamine-1-phosphate N-acetyltransferase
MWAPARSPPNYDGVRKHRTLIGSGSKTGANSTLVAP